MNRLLPWTAFALFAFSGCGMAELNRAFSLGRNDAHRFATSEVDQSDERAESSRTSRRKSSERRDAFNNDSGIELAGYEDAEAEASADPLEDTVIRAQKAENANQLTEAKKLYLEVLKQQPTHAVANHRLAIIADKEGKFAEAERYYKVAMHQTPQNANLLSDIGYSYYLQGRIDESETLLKQALQLQPGHAIANTNLAFVYAKRAQATKSRADYDKTLAQFRRAGSEQAAQANLKRLFPNGPPETEVAKDETLQNPFNSSPLGSGVTVAASTGQTNREALRIPDGDTDEIHAPSPLNPQGIRTAAAELEAPEEKLPASPPKMATAVPGDSAALLAPESTKGDTPAIQINPRPVAAANSPQIEGNTPNAVPLPGESLESGTDKLERPEYRATITDVTPGTVPPAGSMSGRPSVQIGEVAAIGTGPAASPATAGTAGSVAELPRWPSAPQAAGSATPGATPRSLPGSAPPSFGATGIGSHPGAASGSPAAPAAQDSSRLFAAQLGLHAGPGQMFPMKGFSPTASGPANTPGYGNGGPAQGRGFPPAGAATGIPPQYSPAAQMPSAATGGFGAASQSAGAPAGAVSPISGTQPHPVPAVGGVVHAYGEQPPATAGGSGAPTAGPTGTASRGTAPRAGQSTLSELEQFEAELRQQRPPANELPPYPRTAGANGSGSSLTP